MKFYFLFCPNFLEIFSIKNEKMAAFFLNNSRIGHNSKIEQNKKKNVNISQSRNEKHKTGLTLKSMTDISDSA